MNPSLLLVYEKLERQRTQLMELLTDVPEEKINTAPTGKWSIAQILSHLLTSEKLSTGYMYKKSLGIETLRDSGMKQSVLSVVLKISQRIPVKYKAPKIVEENTPEAMPLAIVIKQWDEVRTSLKALLKRIDDKHQKRLIFKHPIAGKFNAKQAVDFMYEHVNHHLPQINKLLND